MVQRLTERAYVPFSEAPSAALALLSDGSWVPGVRIDSAAFSLSLSAAMNALTTAVTLGVLDEVVALVLSRSARPADRQYVGGLPGTPFLPWEEDVLVRDADDGARAALPAPTAPRRPFLLVSEDVPDVVLAHARRLAQERAYTPASGFPVGALLACGPDRIMPGVNVEHPDWSRILCAERNALSAAYAYGVADRLETLYLSCPLDAQGTPCGACRQWLVELAPDMPLWMDRDPHPPEHRTPKELLPGSFSGQAIPRRTL